MPNEREIKIVLRADGTAAIAGIRSVGTEVDGLGSRASSLAQTFQKNWASITVGVGAAYLGLQQIWGAMDAAAGYQEKLAVLNQMSAQYGMTAQDLTRKIKENSTGLVDVATAANVAADALAKGLRPEQVEQIAKWAPTLADVSGGVQSTSEAFRQMTEAISNARDRGVVTLMGATIDLNAELGEQYSKMSKVEKSAAMYNAVAERMAKIQETMGNQADSAADRMERFNNSLTEAKIFLGQLLLVIGQPFMAVFNTALAIIAGVAAGIGSIVQNVAWLTDTLKITAGAEAKVKVWVDNAFAFAADQAGQAKDNLLGGVEQLLSLGRIGAEMGKQAGFALADATGKNMKALEDAEKEREVLLKQEQDALKKAAEEEAKVWGEIAQKQIDADEKVRQAAEENLKYLEGKVGEFVQFEIDEINRTITEGYDRWIEKEMRLIELKKEMAALAADANAANLAGALGALGGGDLATGINATLGFAEGTDPQAQEIERYRLMAEEKLRIMAELNATEEEMERARAESKIALETLTLQRQLSMSAASFSMMGNIANAFYLASEGKSKAAFRVYQAMKIGEATMNTYSGAIAAYQALAGIPIVGPALGAAAAAAVIAYGMMQVKSIASLRPGGGAMSAIGSAPASSGSAGSIPTLPEVKEEKPANPTQIVNVHVYGNIVDQDQFAREMVPALQKALDDGVK
jgi:hypothetical protein